MCVCIGVCMHVCICVHAYECLMYASYQSWKKYSCFMFSYLHAFLWQCIDMNFKVCFSINILLKNCGKIQIAWNLNRFLCVLHSIVNYIYIIIWQKPRTFSSCMTKILHWTTPLFYLPVAPGNYHSTFCFYEFDYFIYLL